MVTQSTSGSSASESSTHEPANTSANPLADRPLVSIVVPSYNQGQFIEACIDSILAQTYQPKEILIIDGASTDNTLTVLKKYADCPELTIVSEPDEGVVDAVNKGLAMASGKICGIQSTDDLYLPNAISHAVHAFQQDANLVIAYGDMQKIDADGQLVSTSKLDDYSLAGFVARDFWMPQPSTFFLTQLARDVGSWREPMAYAADTDLWLRLIMHGTAKKIPYCLGAHRRHPDQRDTQDKKITAAYWAMYQDWLQRYQPNRALRQAAKAGWLLLQNRYRDDDSEFTCWRRRWRALLLWPRSRLQHRWFDYILGYWTAYFTLTKLRQRILVGLGLREQSTIATERSSQSEYQSEAQSKNQSKPKDQ